MAPPRSRLRKQQQQRKRIDRTTPWLLLSSSIVIVILYTLSAVVVIDDGVVPYFEPTGSNELEMVAQCSESCSEVILSREDILSGSSPPSSDSLALSAADALFSLREGDDDDQSPTTTPTTGSKQQTTYGTTTQQQQQQGWNQRQVTKHNMISTQTDKYRNNVSSPRPTRLPPLIKSLVGTIDGTNEFGIHPPPGDFAAPGTTTTRQHGPTNGRDVDLSTRSGGDDSVAMVAAAAAAALWSESENRQGRFRMKAFNEEWESSLRWIASWGPQQHGNKAAVDHSRNRNSSRAPHHASRGSSRKKRQKGADSGKEGREPQYRNSEEYPGFSDLLDACMAQCTGGTRETHIRDSSTGRVSVSEIRSNAGAIINFRAMISAVKSISSPFVYSSDYLRSLADIQLIKSLLGMAISTAIMLGIRNFVDWWKHKTSLRLLLEEENDQEKIDCGRHKKSKARTSGKKSTSKKTRRKRKEILQVHKSSVSDCSILTGTSNGHEDFSLSSELTNGSISIHEGSKQTRYCDDDHSEDQWSKDHGSSASTYSSSCIACDADTEYCLIQAGSNNPKVVTEATPPVVHFLRQRKSKKSIVHVIESHSNSSRERNMPRSPITQKVKFKTESYIPDFNLKKRATSKTYNLAKSDQDNVIIATPDSPSVPTKEQREEASRALREFQMTQVQKYIKSKQAQRSSSNNVSPKTTPLRTLVHVNSYFEPKALHKVSPRRNVRKVWMEETYKPAPQSESNTANYPSLGAEPNLRTGTNVGQSILNMLDESDDELKQNTAAKERRIEFSAETTNEGLVISPVITNKTSTEGQNQFRSIPLGSLLTPQNKTSSVSSNPWSIKNMDSPCVDLDANQAFRNQSPTLSVDGTSHHSQELKERTPDYTDANICLQVSAREFSPSWDGGRNKGNRAQAW